MAGLTWREGRIVLALVALCTLCQASQAPNYKCFPFSGTSQGKRSHDKSVSRQHRKWGANQCPGPECVAIEPTGDIIREVGTSYEASCLFDPNQVRADEVFFMRWGKTPKDQYRIPHKVVNDSAISIQVMHEEATEYKLRCLTGNTTFLCERTVKFGYLPQDVKNFTCISKNWNKLNCSWTAPENPVTVRYQLTECPKSQKGINWCYWGESDFNDRNTWVMRLTAINQLNQKGVQFEREISVFESVLPDPPVELVAKVNGPYEVNVTWKLPHPIDVFIGGVVHEVSYRERQDGDQPEDVSWILVEQRRVIPDRFKKETFSRVITNLHAYILYDFRVRLHTGTGPIRQSMWSDATIRTERTAATRPTVAPLTDIGTFEIEETLSHRDIYISWQKVDPLFWNGPNFYYNVSVFEVQTNRPVSHEVDIRDAYAKFSSMDKDVAYRFEIIPMNDEGPPGNDLKSVVVVPEMTAILKPINYFKVFAYGDSNNIYSLRWRLPESQQENQKIKSLTLYWCKKDKYEERCQNKLEWVTIEDLNITSKNLTDLENSSLYMFGISVNSNNSSSGIKWHTCIASHGSRPPPLEQFEMTHVSSTEVNLKWILDCRAKAAEPTGFNISYCKAAESLESREQTAESCPPETGMTYETVSDETTLVHQVKNLHPYTNYIFNIAILTEMGLSKWSRSLRVRTKADKPSGSPRLLEARAVGQEWVLLAWEPPLDEERNGKIIKYEVSSRPPVKPTSVMANNTSNVTMYNVTDLEPFTKYEFKVIPCSKGEKSELCGEAAASLDVRTRIGTPGKIESIDQEDQQLEWEHDECNAPDCSFELHYRMNGTEHKYISAPGQLAANFKDMNITCTEHQEEININIRAISIDEDGKQLTGPWKEKKITCHIPVMEWWIILIIVAVCIIVTLILVGVGTYGWDQIKVFQYKLNLDLELPVGLDPNDRSFHPAVVEGKTPWYKNIQILREKKISTSTTTSNTSEEQDLIKPGSERQGRNLSGDSGTSEGDPGDSSGCSVGGESDSSSGSDRVHQSSDSGTVQEEPGFPAENKWSGSVRLRTPGPPYVRQGMPEKIPDVGGYVSVGSVPNLAGGITEGLLSLQQSTPSLGLGTLPEMPLGARRTSTGYISMPDTDAEGINLPLDVLGNFTFPHEGRAQSGFPAYSRHNFSSKKGSTPELSQYTKAESLPWLNTGYVAVAQADGVMRETPSAGGYVALGDGIGGMKRQPSLPSLPFGMDKSITTPDEDLPPGAYCRVGARGSPGPPPAFSTGYVSITQDLPSQTTPTITASSSVNKSPYVTCAMAEAIASPKKEPEKVKTDYVSVGEMPNGCWAQPVVPPSTSEESREVTSAPLEGSRVRPSLPARPNTSETNHNRAGNRWTPLGPSLSKQSSGYVSGNVSQETLAFHDPVVMSPKKLLARSHEPHSVVFSPNHKSSMV
ncbi:cytokine receptor isoform X2 [Procambarus clarkii]|uniref:cytokine receptor isoform X2 n=1 Tax=Procambarus clarkii TaxID=6728 RepID=UPI0037427980